jgi:hypothetical protein
LSRVTASLERLRAALADRYRLAREIGAGGMATVYLARDIRHDRDVAIKVLKPELGAVLGVERFLSEIRVTANLQHPNLLPLFDSGEAEGLLYYVMPFVEGETLRARLDREQQLPVDEAVRLTSAIAGALAYAHERGVIHRDLKPENILLQAGQPVIADFGIALAVSNAGGARVTQTGLSLGTPQYMSPEQATGDKVIDARSDIYSLAAMTYEMLTGEPPHTGTSAQAIIAKLLTEEVRPLTVLRRTVPPHVDAAVRHGLEKLAADRFATAADFAAALSGARPVALLGTVASHATTSDASTSGRMRALMAGLAVVAIGGVSAAAWFATRPAPQPAPMVFDLGLPDSVTLYSGGGSKLALSRDGSTLVFAGERRGTVALYVRHLHDPVAQLIRGSEQTSNTGNVSPVISPDGAWVAFGDIAASPQRIMKLPLGGGTAQVLADSGQSMQWGVGDVLAYSGTTSIWTSTPARRAGEMVATRDTARGVYSLSWPALLPGNTHALVSLTTTRSGPPIDSMRLGVVSLTDGTVTDLGVRGTFARYVPTGHILFVRRPGLLMVAPFSVSERRITGPEAVLLDDVWVGSGGAGGFAVSDNGTLAVHREGQGLRRRLVAVDARGAERPIPGEPQDYIAPRVSPDGARILAGIGGITGARAGYVVLIDAGTGAAQPIVQGRDDYGAVWSRDGVHVLFLRRTARGTDVLRRPWDGRAGETVVARALPRDLRELSPGPVGGVAAVVRERGTFGSDLFQAPMDSLGSLRPLLSGSGRYHSPSVSPDGRLLAWFGVDGDELDKGQVFISAIPGPGPRLQVSVGGGYSPLWDPSGTRLYYRGPRRVMMADISTSPLQVTRRDSLFEDTYAGSAAFLTSNWDYIPGRNEFLMIQSAQPRASVPRVVLNWPQLLAAGAGATPR